MTDEVEVLTCYSCGNEVDEPMVIDEHNYCDSCAGNCARCDTEILSDDSIGEYCNECGFYCENCENASSIDDSYEVSGNSWCRDCYSSDSVYCDWCENSYDSGHTGTYNVSGTNFCDDCLSDNCTYCDDCNEYYLDSEGSCDCNGNSSGCRCTNLRRGGYIHDYSCKVNLEFLGSNNPNALFMGFELETQIHGSLDLASAYASQALGNMAILKHDSSISGRSGHGGFELVTQPMTHNYYRNHADNLWSVIDTLREQHTARSWDTDTCGLHIHVSRKAFTGGAHTHRFLAFIYKNAEMMMKFAGRKTTYARFNDVWRFDEYDRPYLSLMHKLDHRAPSERHSAVNTLNEDTLELRFFRGTMNPSGIRSALDLTQAIFDYTKELRVSDVQLGALSWEWFRDYVESNNGLYPDLYTRIDKVKDVNINKPIKQNAQIGR